MARHGAAGADRHGYHCRRRCLGLTNRQAAQHAQLGKIIPELLDEMITKGPPADHDLRTIACATLENQRAALKKSKNRNGLNWWEIANLLRIRSYTRNVALFDIDKTPTVTWQRDAFAEPGAADEWTTTDVDAFMKAQRAAIEAKVAAEKKRRLPVEVAEFDAHGPKIRLAGNSPRTSRGERPCRKATGASAWSHSTRAMA